MSAQVIGSLLLWGAMLVHDLPPFFSLEENQRLTAASTLLLSILYEGKVRIIGGNANISKYVYFQILDLHVQI